MCIRDRFPGTEHVETVMSLVQQKPDDIVKVGIDADKLAVTKAESKATYGEIQARVKEQTGLNVTPLYIAQVKRKHGIIERECYNKAKSESAKMLICPPDKEKAIEDALTYANVAASLSTEKFGAQTGMPTAEEVETELKK